MNALSRPWRFSAEQYSPRLEALFEGRWVGVATLLNCGPPGNELRDAHAEFMLRAINAHDQLLAVVQDLCTILDPKTARPEPRQVERLHTKARRALAKAIGNALASRDHNGKGCNDGQ